MVTNKERKLLKIIKQICCQHGYKYHTFANDWIIQITNKQKNIFIYGYDFPIDNSPIKRLCDDKAAMHEALTYHSIPTFQSFYFIRDSKKQLMDNNNYQKCIDNILKQKEAKVVIKPNNGTSGEFVYNTDNKQKAYHYCQKLLSMDKDILIQPYYQIDHEYRVVMFKNKPYISFEKVKQGSWKFNLSQGAMATEINPSIKKKLYALATKLTKQLNINFCSVDIVDCQGEYLVIEVNGGVMIEKYITTKQRYQEAYQLYEKVIVTTITEEIHQ